MRRALGLGVTLAIAVLALAEVERVSAACFFITERCQVGGVELPTLADAGAAIIDAVMAVVGGIVDALLAIVNVIIDLLPDAPDLGLSIPAGWIVAYTWIDQIVPLHEALFWTGTLAAAAMAPVVFHLAIAIYHLIPKPFSGT
jgi:hypothetical protein